ncbi:MAG: hypothetical protein VXW29_06700 [SAR324 cluster bacterium]|nr:hypothetical protein [SAR324 cluster bacterium]
MQSGNFTIASVQTAEQPSFGVSRCDPAGTFDSPSFWFETDEAVQICTRSKAPFVDVSFSDSHETVAYYAPIQSDRPGLSIQDEQPLKPYVMLHMTEQPAD